MGEFVVFIDCYCLIGCLGDVLVLVIHLLIIGCYCFIGCLGEFFVLVIHLLFFYYWLFYNSFVFLSYLLLVAWDSWPSLNLCEKQCSTSVSGTYKRFPLNTPRELEITLDYGNCQVLLSQE